jgi:hypothetical protein
VCGGMQFLMMREKKKGGESENFLQGKSYFESLSSLIFSLLDGYQRSEDGCGLPPKTEDQK